MGAFENQLLRNILWSARRLHLFAHLVYSTNPLHSSERCIYTWRMLNRDETWFQINQWPLWLPSEAMILFASLDFISAVNYVISLIGTSIYDSFHISFRPLWLSIWRLFPRDQARSDCYGQICLHCTAIIRTKLNWAPLRLSEGENFIDLSSSCWVTRD